MEIRAAGRPGRSNDKDTNTTKEDKSSNKNQHQITRQTRTRINKTKHNQQEHSNHTKNRAQEHNPHLAWNPDSLWSR